MVSAGDHERLPKKDDDNDVEDLMEKSKGFIIDEKMLAKMRKGAKPSRVMQKYLGKNIKEIYSETKNKTGQTKSPVKRKSGNNLTIPPSHLSSHNIQSGEDFIKMAMGNKSLKVNDKVRDKLFRKK